jgi:hypothetical protein
MSVNPHDLYTVFSITDDKLAVPVANWYYNQAIIATERGDIYSGMALLTINSGATATLHLNTSSSKDTYLMGYQIATSATRVTEKIYEEPTITAGTTELAMKNTNRQSSNVFTGTVYTDSVVTDLGTLIDENEIFEAKKSLGGIDGGNGFRLLFKRSTDYILQVTNGDNSNYSFFFKFYFYER